MYNVTMEPYLSTLGIPEKTMHDWLRLPNRPRKSYKKYNFSYVGVI